MPQQLTKSVENQITLDWQHELPSLGVYRPRHLLRRVGPLLIGVCLDRDSGGEKYKPCFHVHFLGKSFPVVSLTMCTQLKAKSGGPDFVEVKFHQELFKDAARRMAEQSPLALKGPITIQQVLGAYREHAMTPLGQRQYAILHGDCILLLSMVNRQNEARSLLSEILKDVSDERAFQSFGGPDSYANQMLNWISHPESICRTVDDQIRSLGLTEIPNEILHC